MKLLIGLGILGLVLLVAAIFLLSRPSKPSLTLPEGSPILVEDLWFVMRGRFDRLYFYEDGNIVFTQDINLRIQTPQAPPTRIWRTGKLDDSELEQVLGFFRLTEFAALEDEYQFPGKQREDGAMEAGDMIFTVSIDFDGVNKSVTAANYLTPDNNETYPDMPYPLNDIYVALKNVVSDSTVEVARERIK
jgi:hypothetical protein